MTKPFGLRAKTYSYLIDEGSEGKKAKGTKNCVIKRKLKFENHKNCLESCHLEKNKIVIDRIKESNEGLIKNNKSILKTQPRFNGALSGLRQFLTNESPLKMMKNAFYFILKALFVPKIFKFLS